MACPAAFTYIEFAPSMWNMNFLQSEPRRASELQPVLMNSTLARCTTCAMAAPEADEISPTIAATLSRSTKRSALAEAVCGLTESSIRSSILRPMTPPPALISSAAICTAMTAYSPSGPRKPVRGVRWPMRIASAWALTMAGAPIPASAAKPPAPFRSVRRVGSFTRLMAGLLPPKPRLGDPLAVIRASHLRWPKMRALSNARRHRRGLRAAAFHREHGPGVLEARHGFGHRRVARPRYRRGERNRTRDRARLRSRRSAGACERYRSRGARRAWGGRPGGDALPWRCREPRRRGSLLRRSLASARRTRRAREQRGHRRADRTCRGYRPGGLGPLLGSVPDRTVQLRAAGRAAPEAKPKCLDRKRLLGGGPLRVSAPHPLRRR